MGENYALLSLGSWFWSLQFSTSSFLEAHPQAAMPGLPGRVQGVGMCPCWAQVAVGQEVMGTTCAEQG